MSSASLRDKEAELLSPPRRGRTRKSRESIATASKPPTTAQPEQQPRPETRGRGRLRKSIVTSPEPPTTPQQEQQPQPKKRGGLRKYPPKDAALVPAETPDRPPRGVKRKRRRPRKQKEEFAVRGIIDEDDNRFLIDWEDNETTGEKYEPSWEPKENVGAGAIEAWEETKAQKKAEEKSSGAPIPEEEQRLGAEALHTAAEENTQEEIITQESEPVREAKRRRREAVEEDAPHTQESQISEPVRPAKRRRALLSDQDREQTEPTIQTATDDTPILQEQHVVVPEEESGLVTASQDSEPIERAVNNLDLVSQPETHLEDTPLGTADKDPSLANTSQETDFVSPAPPITAADAAPVPPITVASDPSTSAVPQKFPLWQAVSDFPAEIEDSFEATSEAVQTQSQKLQVALAVPEGFDRYEYCRISQLSSEFATQQSPAERSFVRSQSAGEKLRTILGEHTDRVIPDSQEATGIETPEFRRSARSKTWPETPEKEALILPESADKASEDESQIHLIVDSTAAEGDTNIIEPEAHFEEYINFEPLDVVRNQEEVSEQNGAELPAVATEASRLITKLVPSSSIDLQSDNLNNSVEDPIQPSASLEVNIESASTPETPLGRDSLQATPNSRPFLEYSSQVSNTAEILNEPFQSQLPFIRDNSVINDRELDFFNRSPSIIHESLFLSTASPGSSDGELSGPVKINTQGYSTAKYSKESLISSSQSWQAAQFVRDTHTSPQASPTSHQSPRKGQKAPVHISKNSVTKSPFSQRDPNSQQSFAHIGSAGQLGNRQDSSDQQIPTNIIMSIERPDDIGDESEIVDRPLPSAGPTQFNTSHDSLASRENSSIRDGLSLASTPGESISEMFRRKRRETEARILAELSPANVEASTESVKQNETTSLPNVDGQSLAVREAPTHLDELSAEIPELSTMEPEVEGEEGDDSPLLPLRAFGPMEHVVLTPMVPMVRDLYNNEIAKWRLEIEALRSGKQLSPEDVDKMDELIENLKLLGDHQDLICGADNSQETMMPDTICKWALTCSPKCLFLERLLDSMRSSHAHVAILARPGMMLDILGAILEANNFRFDRPDKAVFPNPSAQGSLRVTLLPTGFEGGQYVVSPADAVIAFDSSFFTGERYSGMLRAHTYDPQKSSPLIVLVTEDSAEHIELCLRKSLDPVERKTHLINFICQKRKEIGMDTSPRPEDAAVSVANYLLGCLDNWWVSPSDARPEWTLAQNLNVSNLRIPESLSQQSGSTTQSQTHQAAMSLQPPTSTKRPLADTVDEDMSKRMRMMPAQPEAVSSGEVTRISDSITSQAQLHASATDAAEQAITASAALDEAQSDQVTHLIQKVADLQIQLSTKADTEAQLRILVESLELRLAEHVDLVNKFQPLWQTSISSKHAAELALSTAESRAATLSKKLAARDAEISDLKTKSSELQDKLKEASEALQNSTIPEVRELEQLKAKLQTAETDKEKAEKRLASTARDFDFTREQYQRASGSAASLADEVSSLKETNAVLARQADANKVRIHEIQAANESEQLGERIDELQAENEMLRTELWRKHEELRNRGCRGLRGVSTPRSPRVGGSPMLAAGFGNGARGSRSSSQTPGEGGGNGGLPPRWNGTIG